MHRTGSTEQRKGFCGLGSCHQLLAKHPASQHRTAISAEDPAVLIMELDAACLSTKTWCSGFVSIGGHWIIEISPPWHHLNILWGKGVFFHCHWQTIEFILSGPYVWMCIIAGKIFIICFFVLNISNIIALANTHHTAPNRILGPLQTQLVLS